MPILTHNHLLIAKKALGETHYFTSEDAFIHWLEIEHPDMFFQSSGDEFRVYESQNFNTSSIATYKLTQSSFASLEPGEDD